MTEKEKKFLSDISRSIELIESFTKDITSFERYQNDLKTKAAVERHLSIIGEAVNKFLQASTTGHLDNASHIISLRNRIIHSYDTIDDAMIWTILTRHLPHFREEIRRISEK